MEAVLCHEYGHLRLERCAPPKRASGQVRLGLRAASVGFADTLKVKGAYQVKTPVPFIPGTEAAGIVLEKDADFEGIDVGDRVLAVMTHDCGAWAQECVIDAQRVVKLPDGMSFEEAACLPSAYGTSYYALKQRAQLKPGEVVVVLGAAGGVGLAAVSIAKAMGATVIAAASTGAKLELAQAHGADYGVNYRNESLKEAVARLTGGRGADVVFDPVGGELFEDAIRSVAFEGRVLIVGFASGTIPEARMNHVLLKGYDLRGVRYDTWRDQNVEASKANLRDVLQWHAQGQLRVAVTRRYALDQAQQALAELAEGKALGKQVFQIQP